MTQSDLTVVITLLLTVLLWMRSGWSDLNRWGSLALVVFAAYLMLEMNNRCHMLRVRSRMVSSSFLFLMAVLPQLHTEIRWLVLPLCLAAEHLLLFHAYQQRRTVGRVFYASLILGLGALCFPPLVLLLPVQWFCMSHHLRVLSFRSWVGSVVGVLLPLSYGVAAETLTRFYQVADVAPVWTYEGAVTLHTCLVAAIREGGVWFENLIVPVWPDLSLLISIGVVGVELLWSIIHFQRTDYKDVIRTRMYYKMFCTELLGLLLLVTLWPCHIVPLLTATLMLAAPLIAHWATLAEGQWAERGFWLSLILFAALAIINYTGLPALFIIN